MMCTNIPGFNELLTFSTYVQKNQKTKNQRLAYSVLTLSLEGTPVLKK